MDEPSILNLAAIIDSCVVKDGAPILRAIRDNPLQSKDSGWQFLSEKVGSPLVLSVAEVLQIEPSLSQYIMNKPGVEIIRKCSTAPWSIITVN